ncbi:hypothetical protein OSSY52_18460 [Tepiditoga spiralis]|uniref:Uncharacterized protein n=1 Tax=Tepiditoga spiralis TaxID=2108365 RepID=A0A7G1G6B3_9BACT|nr:hypothetical protein [Tepiditoga spiralis]BBE31705.1 hypothetical protein OSSY52_18460 [Tepiditoga spiralis]
MKKKYFQRLYKYDDENNNYIIEVSLNNYEEVYDDWDPSPFKKRDIEEEFNYFIMNSSKDIPLKYGLTIVLYLPESKKDDKKEKTLKTAYLNFYNYINERIKDKLLKLYRKIFYSFFFSIFLLIMSMFILKDVNNMFFKLVREGFSIGGWVFLWEAFTDFFWTRNDIISEYKIYKRLNEAKINFVYK